MPMHTAVALSAPSLLLAKLCGIGLAALPTYATPAHAHEQLIIWQLLDRDLWYPYQPLACS